MRRVVVWMVQVLLIVISSVMAFSMIKEGALNYDQLTIYVLCVGFMGVMDAVDINGRFKDRDDE